MTGREFEHRSIGTLLRDAAMHSPDAVAVLAPHRHNLSYRRLWDHVRGVVRWLNAFGIRRGDRVAIVCPNGPEMATAFLGVSVATISAPLNPGYTADEFSFYLGDLDPKAVITQHGVDSAVRTVAAARGIPVIELTPSYDAAGIFSLNGDVLRVTDTVGEERSTDVALVLHTSGTTSRPKRVPLTHENLCSSACNVASSLMLSERDRCLNVMPLFHVHAIVAALLASLSRHGGVVCTPGFDEIEFFDWMHQLNPTWYTAVPTIHQAILRRASRAAGIVAHHRLRFVRSSSAPLPLQVANELEEVFKVPIIDAYGMTEAAHQITSNSSLPRARRAGSVGIAEGCEVAVMDDSGKLLPRGETGEVVIRGRNVTGGYENDPDANARAFVDGWCRTGDQGRLDADGFLSLTGRLKEIINRGGEKIAPREIDDILLTHPAVREAVAFALPHPTLGEGIAAAVVLQDRSLVNEFELREFASVHLPPFKVPDRIVAVEKIPKGPTGKVRRTELAQRLSDALIVPHEAPVGALEQLCVDAFQEILHLNRVGRNDNFFALGGDSIRATQVISRLVEAVGVELAPTVVFRHPTPASLATQLAFLRKQETDLASIAEELRQLPAGEAARLLGDRRGTSGDDSP